MIPLLKIGITTYFALSLSSARLEGLIRLSPQSLGNDRLDVAFFPE
jgi:hypothetical protein